MFIFKIFYNNTITKENEIFTIEPPDADTLNSALDRFEEEEDDAGIRIPKKIEVWKNTEEGSELLSTHEVKEYQVAFNFTDLAERRGVLTRYASSPEEASDRYDDFVSGMSKKELEPFIYDTLFLNTDDPITMTQIKELTSSRNIS